MRIRSVLIIGCAAMVAGCASTSKPTGLNQLQIRTAHVESRLDDHDVEIMQLKTQVDEVATATVSKSITPKPARDIFALEPAVIKKTAVAPQITSSEKYQHILRVPVAPQEVQKALKNAGYYTAGAVDGKLGPASQRAIKEFQKDHGLESDGIVGKKTWAQMKDYLEF